MNKQIMNWHGKKYFLLGIDNNGTKYFIEAPRWSCDWYWGLGYVETFTNNRSPERSADINSHQHFDSLFFDGQSDSIDNFEKFFKESTVNRDELYLLIDYFRSAYSLKETAAVLKHGNSNYTCRAYLADLEDGSFYEKINHEMLPAIFSAIEKLLSPTAYI